MSATLDLPLLALVVGCLVGIFGPEMVGPARRKGCPYGFHWLNPYQRDQCVRMAYRPRQQPDTIRKDFGWFLPDKSATKRTTTPRYPGGQIPWYDSPEVPVRPPMYPIVPSTDYNIEQGGGEGGGEGEDSDEPTEEPEEGGQNTTTTTTKAPTKSTGKGETTTTTTTTTVGTPEENKEGNSTLTPGGGDGTSPIGETPIEGGGTSPDGETPIDEGGTALDDETPVDEGDRSPPLLRAAGDKKSSKSKANRKADQVQEHSVVDEEWHPWSWSKPKRTQKAPSKVVPKRKPPKSDAVEENQREPDDEWHPWSWSKPRRSKQAPAKVAPSRKSTTKKPLSVSSQKPQKTIRKAPAKVRPLSSQKPKITRRTPPTKVTIRKAPTKVTIRKAPTKAAVRKAPPKPKTFKITEEFPLWSWNS